MLTVNHKDIGLLYIFLGMWGFISGLTFSQLMRSELQTPGDNFFPRYWVYNTVVTSHAIAMIFYGVMPVMMGGLGNLFVPLYISAGDMAFPRLNAFSFWLMPHSFAYVFYGMFMDSGLNAGWTLYPPLSTLEGSPGRSVDNAIMALHLAGMSSILGSVNYVMTMGGYRRKTSPISSISMLPMCMGVTGLLLALAVPVLGSAMTMLLLDRNWSGCFFRPLAGGSALSFQHMFWFFGHPEVYILALPAFAVASQMILSNGAKSNWFGKLPMAWSVLSIMFMGCFVWGHHMFTVGMDLDTRAYYSAATALIAIPTGVKIYSWLSTMMASPIRPWSIGILWIMGFLFLFTFGGLSGILLSNGCVDMILHDTYYVVAHFHFVLSTGVVFCLTASLVNWFSLWTGCGLKPSILVPHFFLSLMSALLAFLPQHLLGLAGMPRRYVVYSDIYWCWHEVSSFGAMGARFSLWILLISMWESLTYVSREVKPAMNNSLDIAEAVCLSLPRHTWGLDTFCMNSDK